MRKEVFHQLLFAWWREHGRVLPWRRKQDTRYQILDTSLTFQRQHGESSVDAMKQEESIRLREKAFESYFAGELFRDPYRVVVSEVMLQQTQVDRVIPKYEAWMEKWPTIQDLAQASLGEVLIQWQGLGYNRRARFLWLLAKEIVEQRNGVWPKEEEELLKLSGIGRYTARAILSFAFGKQVGVVDVNVKRVYNRWWGLQQPMQTPLGDPEYSGLELFFKELGLTFQDDGSINDRFFFNLADEMLPDQADPWNQALMDFGALVCTAKNPKCESCPMAEVCAANRIAREKGWGSYREWLAQEKGKPDNWKTGKGKRHKRGKDAGLKFEQTDRFFRGRIIDILREKEALKEDLFVILHTKYDLENRSRFESLIESLQNEQLITVKGETIQLGFHE